MKTLIGGHAMIAGTVAQSPISIGHLAAEKMYEYLAGKDIENEVVIPVQLINEDNIEMYDETVGGNNAIFLSAFIIIFKKCNDDIEYVDCCFLWQCYSFDNAIYRFHTFG